MSKSGKERTAISRQRAKELRVIEEGGDINVWKDKMDEMKFVKNLRESEGRLIEAVLATFPELKKCDNETRYAKGQEMLKRTTKRMSSALKALGADPTYIIASVLDIAENSEKDAVRLKAFQMLAEFNKMFGAEKPGNQIINNLNISEDAAVRILERRRKHDIGAGGSFLGLRAGGDSDDNDGAEVVN